MRLLLLCLLLLGCAPEKPAKYRPKEQRLRDAEIVVGKTPAPRTYSYPEGDLRVLEVKFADRLGYVETQRCFIWRDRELGNASISCNAPPDSHDLPNLDR